MSSSSMSHKLPLRNLCLLALYGALMTGFQVAMASLPNIEPVSLMLICATIVFGPQALYACAVFVLLEGLIFGFGLWFVSYIYIWPVLVGVALLLRRNSSPVLWAVVSGGFGLLFGALCAVPYAIFAGWQAGVAYWISGIPYDLLHCVGNAVLAALLQRPLTKLLSAAAQGRFK